MNTFYKIQNLWNKCIYLNFKSFIYTFIILFQSSNSTSFPALSACFIYSLYTCLLIFFPSNTLCQSFKHSAFHRIRVILFSVFIPHACIASALSCFCFLLHCNTTPPPQYFAHCVLLYFHFCILIDPILLPPMDILFSVFYLLLISLLLCPFF